MRLTEILKCPICGQDSSNILTDRMVSPYQNRLFSSKAQAHSVGFVNVKMRQCMSCGFVWNSMFDDTIELYDEDYHNNQDASTRFLDHVDLVIDKLSAIVKDYKIEKIVEVGCGPTAYFLKKLCDKTGVVGEAWDPSIDASMEHENIRFHKKYFDFDRDMEESRNLIVSRHVIEHISTPINMINSIIRCVNKCGGYAYIETPDVAWIFRNNMWIDFFNEHCSLFSVPSLTSSIQNGGGDVILAENCFDDQYMSVIIGPQVDFSDNFFSGIHYLIKLGQAYAKKEKTMIENAKAYIDSNIGDIFVWGAGAKGNVFLNMLDSDATKCRCIDIDINKQGKYISGSGHLIESPKVISRIKKPYVIVMNSNYHKEIEILCKSLNDEVVMIEVEELI